MPLHELSSSSDRREFELAYAEITALATISAATEGAAASVISAGALTFDGVTRICIEFYTAKLERGTGGNTYLNLYEDSTDLGRLAQTAASSGSGGHPALVRRFRTPSAGTKTYSVRGWRDTTDGFVNAQSPYLPSYIRITVADTL